LPDMSFEEIGKLAEQRSQLQTPRPPQPIDKPGDVPVVLHQLLDDRAGFLNFEHGRKYDLLFRFKVRFQITFKETDHSLSPFAEPIQIGMVLRNAAMDSQTDEQTVVMLAREGTRLS
jgi:hypothetical protein